MRIRQLMLAAPVVVLLLFVAAFAISRPYFHVKQDALVIASIGEPEILNPVLSTTTAASDIQDFVFDTLLKLDENAQITTNLAKSYELIQATRLYFASPEQAAQVVRTVEGHRGQWKDLGLQAAKAQDDAVELLLTKPGTGYQHSLLEWIAPTRPMPFQRWQVQIAPDLKWQGKPVTSDTLIEWIGQTRPVSPAKPRVIYAWKNTSGTLEIYTIGADGAFMDGLQRAFAGRTGLPVKVAAKPAGTANAPTSGPTTQGTPTTLLAGKNPQDADPPSLPAPDMQLQTEGPLQIQFDKDWPAQDEPLMTLHLRNGVQWQDGAPFSAADVKFTYEAFMNEKNASPRRSDFELIKDIQIPDDLTVQVRYKEPYSPCLYTWAGYPIIPRHLLADEPDMRHLSPENRFNQFPIGTGPFKMESWVTGQRISLVRNEHYWEGKPHLPRIVYRIIPDPTVSQLEFQTGGFDFDGLQPYEVTRFLKDPHYSIYRGPSPSYDYIGWNLKSPYFKDKRVRLAMAYAIDVQAIIRYIMYGNAAPATGPYTPVTPWFDPSIKPIPFDPAKAKELLAEAGWTPGPDGILQKDGKQFHFTIITNNANTIRKDIAVLAQQYLRNIGIEVEVIQYEWAVFIKQYIDARNFDACVLGWVTGRDQDLYQLFDSSQVSQPESLNFVSYSNPQVDRLIADARTEFDMTKVRRDTAKIQRLIYEDQPYLFLYYPEATAAMSKGLYYVQRPDEQPGQEDKWITEPIRRTKVGFRIYQTWWKRGEMPNASAPGIAP